MASIIKIKRSTGNAPPTQLGSGELAYAWDESGGFQNGKLFVGTGTETAGAAANVEIIGGKYFTNLLDHTTGTVVASSALLVDANKKLNELLVDNITIDGNTVSTTNTNGNLVLSPNGTGLVSIGEVYTLPNTVGSSGQVLVTDGTGAANWSNLPASNFTLAGNTGTDTFNTGETLTISGTGGVSTAVTNNTFSISLSNIPNSALANSAVTIGTTSVSLGGSSTTLAGLTSVSSTSFTGALTGNASTATTLQTARTINGISFNGSANITVTANTTNALTIGTGLSGTSFNGSSAVTIALASAYGDTVNPYASKTANTFLAAPSGGAGAPTFRTIVAADIPVLNQNTTGSAASLTTARSIAISGPITGTATNFNGTANITIPVTALDVGHANVTGTLAVDHGGTGVTTSTGSGSNVLSTSPAFSGVPTAPTAAAGTNTTQIATTEFVRTEVDNARVGIDAKDSVRAATTANITLSNTQTVDGIALAVGDRVLVKNQTNAVENGIYLVASGAWTRTADAVTGTLTSGAFAFVESGTTNSDSGWVLSTAGTITVGTTAQSWVQFSGAGQIIAGNGLTKTGNTLDVGAGTGITVAADTVGLTGQALALHNLATNGLITRTASGVVSARAVAGVANRTTVTNGDGVSGNPTVDIASTYVGQNTITTLGTIATGTWAATDVAVSHGGTGVSSLAARGIVYGNGTSAVGVTAASAIDGSFLREDASGNPYWSNTIDGGTY